MRLSLIPVALLAVAAAATTLSARTSSVLKIHSNYAASELLSPCQEADNDARWGQAAEVECEQYIIGFVDALEVSGVIGGEDSQVCLPEQNKPDEVRWAFMRWVHQDFTARKQMVAAEAMMMTLQENFPCR